MSLPSLLLPLRIGANADKRGREEDDEEDDEVPAAARQRVERVLAEQEAAGLSDEQRLAGFSDAQLRKELERRRAASEVIRAHLASFSELSDDTLRLVFAALAAADCRSVGKLCQANSELAAMCRKDWMKKNENDEPSFWQILCENNGWGPPRFQDDRMPWRREFIRRCTWGLSPKKLSAFSALFLPHVAMDGDMLAAHGGGGNLGIFPLYISNMATGTTIRRDYTDPPAALALDATAGIVFIGYLAGAGNVHMFDIASGNRLVRFVNPGPAAVKCLALGTRLDGRRYLVVGNAGSINNVYVSAADRPPDGDAIPDRSPTFRTTQRTEGSAEFSRIDSVAMHGDLVLYLAKSWATKKTRIIVWNPEWPPTNENSAMATLVSGQNQALATDGDVLVTAGAEISKNNNIVEVRFWEKRQVRPVGALLPPAESYNPMTTIEVDFAIEGRTFYDPHRGILLSASNGIAVCGYHWQVAILDIGLRAVIRILQTLDFRNPPWRLAFANERLVTVAYRLTTLWAFQHSEQEAD